MADDETAEEQQVETEEQEDYFSGSQVQAEMSADDAYVAAIEELKQEFPEIETDLANNPELAESIYALAREEFG